MPSGKPISDDMKSIILDLWLRGYTYRTIESKTGVSISSISEVIKEVLGREPNYSELRELAVALRKANALPLECLRGAKFLEQLNSLNIFVDNLDPVLKLCKTVENPVEAAQAGLEMLALKEQTGKTYPEILDEWKTKQLELIQVEENLKEKIKNLEDTSKKVEDAKSLERLQDKLRSLNLNPERLQRFVEDAEQIEENGFNIQTSVILSNELKKLGLNPVKVAEKDADLLSRHGSLEKSIESLSRSKGELKTNRG